MKIQFHPVILLAGDDMVSKETFLQAWIEKCVPGETREFNLDILYGSEVSGDDVSMRAMALPMMAEYRTVIVRHADKISSQGVNALAQYVQKPSPSTALILDTSKLDRRQKNWQTISKCSHLIEHRVPYSDKIPSWIIQRCREKYRRKIEPMAARFLFDCVGSNLGELDSELSKLDIFAEEGDRISVEDIRQIVGKRADDVFKWLQAVGERNGTRAVPMIQCILETDRSGVGALTLLARHFYTLLKIKIFQQKGLRDNQIADEMGLNSFFHFTKLGFGRQANGFTFSELEAVLEKMGVVDKLTKSSSGQPKLLLEAVIFSICRSCHEPIP